MTEQLDRMWGDMLVQGSLLARFGGAQTRIAMEPRVRELKLNLLPSSLIFLLFLIYSHNLKFALKKKSPGALNQFLHI